MENCSDTELLQRCCAGEQRAWNVLVRRYQRLVFTVPRRAGLSDDQAADVFQICFARLFEHRHRIEDGSRVRAWLVTTAKRESLRVLQQAQRVVALQPPASADDDADTDPWSQIADPAALPETLLDELQQFDRLHQALARLEPRHRQLLEMLFMQDEPASYGDIAQRLGLAEGSVGPTRARALEKLRKLLHDS